MMTSMMKMKRMPALAALALATCLFPLESATASNLAREMIRVRLFDTQPETLISRLKLSGNYRLAQQSSGLSLAANQTLLISAKGGRLLLTTTGKQEVGGGDSMRLQALGAMGTCVTLENVQAERRCYSGELWIRVSGNRLLLENLILARDYVQSVTAGETSSGWPLEALKAQAVLTQTRLATQRPRRGVVEVSDSTSDERYVGIRKNPLVDKAVQSTWGEVLTYKHRPITVYYHSTCGGHTSDDGYFSGSLKKRNPYSVGVACPYCVKSPFYKTHQANIPLSRWQDVFGDPFVRLSAKDNAGRYRQALIPGQMNNAYVFWLRLGRFFGWDKAPGTQFELRQENGNVLISSRGAGHGVGMCQWGARGMALQGRSYHDILKFYYPQATAENIKETQE